MDPSPTVTRKLSVSLCVFRAPLPVCGGARRDEEKKSQRTNFSVRDDFGQWDENQRPEFDLLNGKIENGQNVRVFHFELDRARCVELHRTRAN
jgi:hypothetical protein